MHFPEFKVDQSTNLNPRYSFDNFVVGGFNELAHVASLVVVKTLGSVYNPLVIYGGLGLGKLHLLQATGTQTINESLHKNLNFISPQLFTYGLVLAILQKK